MGGGWDRERERERIGWERRASAANADAERAAELVEAEGMNVISLSEYVCGCGRGAPYTYLHPSICVLNIE